MHPIFFTLLLLPLLQTSSPEVYTGRLVDHPGAIQLAYPVEYDPNKTQRYLMGNKIILVEPGVISPSLASAFLLENTVINKGESVLDMGCGNGVQGVFAALNGAGNVVAVDIDPKAVVNTRHNAELYQLGKIVDARVGDLFSPLKPTEKFDVVIFNIKYPGFGTGPNAINLHDRFFAELDPWLKPNGRIYYHVGFVDKIPEVSQMLEKHGFRIMRMNMINAVKYNRQPVIYVIQRIKDTQP